MRFNRNHLDLFKLFLICVFPFHTWTIYRALEDVEWIATRTNFADAIGFLGYNLLFALLESFLVWPFLLVISVVLPKHWTKQMRTSILGMIVFVISFWGLLAQLLVISNFQVLYWFVSIVGTSDLSGLIFSVIVIVFIVASFVLPILLLVKHPKASQTTAAIFDRIVVLSGLYLVLDLFGITIVLLRNIS